MLKSAQDLQESIELVDAFEAEISAVEKVEADGKLSVLDIPAILTALPKLIAGINGCWNVPAEIAGASVEERNALAMRCALLLPRAWEAHKKLIEVLVAKQG